MIEPASPTETHNSRDKTLGSRIEALVVPATLLTVWELLLWLNLVPNTLIPTPLQVLRQSWVLMANGQLPKHALVSLMRLLSGFAVGSLLGIWMGAWVGFSRRTSRLLEPTVLSLIPVPPIAWIPVLIIVFGIGELSKLSLISIGSFCTLFIQAAHGIRSTDQSYVELALVLEKDNRSLLRSILFPSALPGIVASMRVAMALSWSLLMASEIIASSAGLGWLIWNSRNFSRPDDMLVAMVTVGFLGKLTDSALVHIGKLVTQWQRGYVAE